MKDATVICMDVFIISVFGIRVWNLSAEHAAPSVHVWRTEVASCMGTTGIECVWSAIRDVVDSVCYVLRGSRLHLRQQASFLESVIKMLCLRVFLGFFTVHINQFSIFLFQCLVIDADVRYLILEILDFCIGFVDDLVHGCAKMAVFLCQVFA